MPRGIVTELPTRKPLCRACLLPKSPKLLLEGICSHCRNEAYWYLIYDPSETLALGRRILTGQFNCTLNDGYWPHGSVWRRGTKLYRVEGNSDTNLDHFYPQRVVLSGTMV